MAQAARMHHDGGVEKRRVHGNTSRSVLTVAGSRLKVTLDRKLGRETSPQVKLLAGMTLPPLVRQFRRARNAQADEGGPAASPE